MKTIKIEWLMDRYNCETCGTSWAKGANVWIDGDLVLELQPHASCSHPSDYSDEDVYKAIFQQLGYEVEESDNA